MTPLPFPQPGLVSLHGFCLRCLCLMPMVILKDVLNTESTSCLAHWAGVGRARLAYSTFGVRSASVRLTWTVIEGRQKSDFRPSSVIFVYLKYNIFPLFSFASTQCFLSWLLHTHPFNCQLWATLLKVSIIGLSSSAHHHNPQVLIRCWVQG